MPSVLIIDDEESIAWALRKACERLGYRTAVAATAEDGLAAARRSPPGNEERGRRWTQIFFAGGGK